VAGDVLFHPRGIRGGRTIGIARVPLPLGLQSCHPCLKGSDPFFLLPNHRQQVNDQLLDDYWRLFPARGIKRQSVGQWEGDIHSGDPRDSRCTAYLPWDGACRLYSPESGKLPAEIG
jgi:hypothetical protein